LTVVSERFVTRFACEIVFQYFAHMAIS